LITSLPFVLAEAGTGTASMLTGQLSIPPLVGPGTVVDGAVLAMGLAVAVTRMLKKERQNGKDAESP